jgi:hypothetical protein
LRSIVNYGAKVKPRPDEEESDLEPSDLIPGGTSHAALPSEGPAPLAPQGWRRTKPPGFESIGRSALSHALLVAGVTAFGVAAGAVVGYAHPPSYNAQAQLFVGRTSGLAEDEVPGLAVAVQGLAADYARLITASNVIAGTEANLHSSSLPGTLIATPIPQSSVIDVIASGANKATAVSLANAAAKALVTVVTKVTNDSQAVVAPMLAAYEQADAVYEQATAQSSALQTQLDRLLGEIGFSTATPEQAAAEQSLNSQIASWDTKADTAKIQAEADQNDYDAAVPPLQTQQEMVQEVGSATYTGSNRKPYIEGGALAGAVGGLLIGLAGATMIDTRKGRRDLAVRGK